MVNISLGFTYSMFYITLLGALFEYLDEVDKNHNPNLKFVNESKNQGFMVKLTLLGDLGIWLSFLAIDNLTKNVVDLENGD